MENIKELIPHISSISTFLEIMKYAKKYGSKIISNSKVRDFDAGFVFDEVCKENVFIGDYIRTEGFLLSYGQVFKPRTLIESVWGPTTEDELKSFNEMHKGTEHELRKEEILFQKRDMFFPVQKINQYSNIGCAFLYDSRFTGFINSNNIKDIKDGDYIYSKPILILYDVIKHSRYINKKVSLKGLVQGVPDYIANEFGSIHDESIMKICSNFYRPYYEGENMICISLLDDKSKIEFASESELYDSFSEFNIPIFIEGKVNNFNNISENKIGEHINRLMPNSYDKHLSKVYGTSVIQALSLRGENDNGFSLPSTDEIQVVYNKCGDIGFYSTASLIDQHHYSESIEKFTRYINNFSVDYLNLSKREFGNKEKIGITFLFDSKKKNLLRNKKIDFIFERGNIEDVNLANKMKWIYDE